MKRLRGFGVNRSHTTLLRILVVFAAPIAHGEGLSVDPCIGAQIDGVDNLFREPDTNVSARTPALQETSAEDYITSAKACAQGSWGLARQQILLDGTIQRNWYANNDQFDHSAGDGSVLWKWQSAGDFSGNIGAKYFRALNSFEYSSEPIRDIVEKLIYNADLRREIGARLALEGGAEHSDSSHSAAQRSFDESSVDTWRSALEYESRAGNTIAAEFKRAEATYPRSSDAQTSTIDRDYADRAAGIRVRYRPGGKTTVMLSAGYLDRTYRNRVGSDFAGDTWRASVEWQTTRSLGFTVSTWQELAAYIDAESDHFVSRGSSLATKWQISKKWLLNARYSLTTRRFLTDGPDPISSTTTRRDRVSQANLALVYVPIDVLEIGLALRADERGSNRNAFDYDSNQASLSILARL